MGPVGGAFGRQAHAGGRQRALTDKDPPEPPAGLTVTITSSEAERALSLPVSRRT